MSALRHKLQKKYLINCHILLQYFKLVFLQLQLVKILCKLISIWVNYEKNKKGSPFMKHHVYCIRSSALPAEGFVKNFIALPCIQTLLNMQ